jgi:hypothetical protein
MVIDRSSLQTELPMQFGEIVQLGARQGTYFGRSEAHYLILWDGEKRANHVSPFGIIRLNRMNESLRLSQHISSKLGVRRKGGLKVGSRIKKKNPLANKQKEMEQQRKQVVDTKVPGTGLPRAGRNWRKTGGESAAAKKGRHDLGFDDLQEKVACLNCGRTIKPDFSRAEPYYCKACLTDLRIPLIHAPGVKE